MTRRSFSSTICLMSLLVASVCTYGCVASSEFPSTAETTAEAQQELSSDVPEINDERPVDAQADRPECDPMAGTILAHTDDRGWFAQRIHSDELSLATDQNDAQSPQNDGAPSDCNGQACTGCAGTCWWLEKPVNFEGKKTWNSSNNTCYCQGWGNYWNCCW